MRAVAPDKVLARVWSRIADILGGCFRSFADSQVLVWMPAHLPSTAVGERKLSNGARLSMLDWRANRLVDGLAKLSASESQVPLPWIELLEAAVVAVRHWGMLSGRVTHAANNHITHELGPDGKEVVEIRRDATQANTSRKRRRSPEQGSCVETVCSFTEPQPQASTTPVLPPPLKAPRNSFTVGRKRSSSQLDEAALLRRRVDEIGTSLIAPVGKPTAAERMDVLRRRLVSRMQS